MEKRLRTLINEDKYMTPEIKAAYDKFCDERANQEREKELARIEESIRDSSSSYENVDKKDETLTEIDTYEQEDYGDIVADENTIAVSQIYTLEEGDITLFFIVL